MLAATCRWEHFYTHVAPVSMTVQGLGQAARLLAAGEEEEDAMQMPPHGLQGWHLQPVQRLLTFGYQRASLHCNVLLERLRAAQPGMRWSQPAQPLNSLFRSGFAGQSRQERDISSSLSVPDGIKCLG